MQKSASKALVLALLSGSAYADMTLEAGLDHWKTPAPMRYSPNYSTPNPWQQNNPWMKFQGSTELGGVKLTVHAKHSEVEGSRIDRLDADYRFTDNVGARVGVLPYRVSWCRTYETTNPWIREPDNFCSFNGLNEISQGAFGSQVYATTNQGNWMIDGMIGIYRPMIDGQDKKLGPYVPVGPTVEHKKQGVSLNALHLGSGTQFRLSYLDTLQNQDSDTGSYQRRLTYKTLYAGVEGNITDKLSYRLSQAEYIGDQNNPARLFNWHGTSRVYELGYQLSSRDQFAFGLSQYTNLTNYANSKNTQVLTVPTKSISWRRDYENHVYSVVQISQGTDTYTTIKPETTYKSGTSIGFRIAKVFN